MLRHEGKTNWRLDTASVHPEVSKANRVFVKRFHSETYFRDVPSHGCDQFLSGGYFEDFAVLAMD
jgi:hypothetical protein